MRIDNLGAVLADRPPTDEELRRGVALRLLGCVRYNDADPEGEPGGFVWSAVGFCLAGTKAPALRLGVFSGLAAAVLGGARCACVHEERLEAAGRTWVAREYAVSVPRLLFSFDLCTAGARMHVSRSLRNELILSRFEDIRNAYADEDAYGDWLEGHRRWLAQVVEAPERGPLISIVTPVFKTPTDYLRAMIDSVIGQTYGRWELVLVNASPDDAGVARVISSYDDRRIKVVEVCENLGIVGNTNVGLDAVSGDYVAFFDHDDFIEPQALAAMASAVCEDPEIDLLYCDEDSYDGSRFRTPLFKPEMNWDLLFSNNYVIHFLTVSRRVLLEVERSVAEAEGAQDYDLTFKVIERGRHVRRLPYVLYHWRVHAGSTNANAGSKPYTQEAGRLMIRRHLERAGIAGEVVRGQEDFTYRVDFGPLEKKTVVRVTMPETAADLSAALEEVQDDLVLLCRDDVEVDASDIDLMKGYFVRPEVFSVTPKILRGEGLVESAGCVVAPGGDIVKLGKGLPAADKAYLGRAVRPCDHVAVDDNAVMLRMDALRGWLGHVRCYETSTYAVNELCAQAYLAGMVNVFTPFATARISGARSLVVDWPGRSEGDRGLYMRCHEGLLAQGDPTHDPNFDPASPFYRLGASQTLGWPAGGPKR